MKQIIFQKEQIKSKESIFQILQKELALPEYFGHNLDALYDVLQEVSVDVHIALPDVITKESYLGTYGKSLIQVLKDSALENEHIHLSIYK